MITDKEIKFFKTLLRVFPDEADYWWQTIYYTGDFWFSDFYAESPKYLYRKGIITLKKLEGETIRYGTTLSIKGKWLLFSYFTAFGKNARKLRK